MQLMARGSPCLCALLATACLQACQSKQPGDIFGWHDHREPWSPATCQCATEMTLHPREPDVATCDCYPNYTESCPDDAGEPICADTLSCSTTNNCGACGTIACPTGENCTSGRRSASATPDRTVRSSMGSFFGLHRYPKRPAELRDLMVTCLPRPRSRLLRSAPAPECDGSTSVTGRCTASLTRGPRMRRPHEVESGCRWRMRIPQGQLLGLQAADASGYGPVCCSGSCTTTPTTPLVRWLRTTSACTAPAFWATPAPASAACDAPFSLVRLRSASTTYSDWTIAEDLHRLPANYAGDAVHASGGAEAATPGCSLLLRAPRDGRGLPDEQHHRLDHREARARAVPNELDPRARRHL